MGAGCEYSYVGSACKINQNKLTKTSRSLPSASAVEVIKMEPSVCVCLSVSALTAEPFGIVMKFGTGIDLDILDKFECQGHRSKVKVIQIKM